MKKEKNTDSSIFKEAIPPKEIRGLLNTTVISVQNLTNLRTPHKK